MRKTLLSICLVWFCFLAQAQQQPGAVSMEMLKATRHARDTGAVAAILYDKGESEFVETDYSFSVRFTRHMRIKLYRKEGFDWANIEVPIYTSDDGRYEKVEVEQALTYYLDGDAVKATPLDPNSVFTEKQNKNVSIKKFAMPNVAEGVIIEFRYRLTSPFLFNLPSWNFQHEIPTDWSEYSVTMVPFFDYVSNTVGAPRFDANQRTEVRPNKRFVNVEYTPIKYRWLMKTVPAFREEAYMTTKRDYLYGIKFQLSKITYPNQSSRQIASTWELLSQELLNDSDFGGNLRQKVYKDQVAALKLAHPKPLDLAKAIYAFVQQRTSWDETRGIYPTQKIKELDTKASGNATDINLLLGNLLLQAGIEAVPVLLSTRDHGLPFFNYPVLDQFNYTIILATVEGQQYRLDATDPLRPFGMLPLRCMNGYGLMLDKKEAKKVSLDDMTSYQTQDYVTVEWDAEREGFTAFFNCTRKGFAGLEFRRQYMSKGEAFLKDVFGENIEQVKVVKDEPEQALFNFTFQMPLEEVEGSDRIYIPSVLGNKLEENPLKQPDRRYPIDYGYRTSLDYRLTLKLPEGYTVTGLPERTNMNLTSKQAGYSFLVENNETSRTVQVLQKFIVGVPVIEATYYSELKGMYDVLLGKQEEMIVIEKL